MERLQKVIAHAGVASRRKAEQLILDGKVTVNDKVVRELGTKVTGKEKIEVEGIPLQREKKVYYVLHKPHGYVSTVSDDFRASYSVRLLCRSCFRTIISSWTPRL